MSSAESYFATHASRFAAAVPGVRSAEPGAIHDARLAIRRMRAALPLLEAREDVGPDDWNLAFRTIGRALGELRDSDMADDLLREFVTRDPAILPVANQVWAGLRVARAEAECTLAAALDSGRVAPVLTALRRRAFRSERSWVTVAATAAAESDRRLRLEVGEKARRVESALLRPSKGYSARRSHKVRLHLRHLRHAIELAGITVVDNEAQHMHALERAISLLGRVHDLQVLIDMIAAHSTGSHAEVQRAFKGLLEAERDDVYRIYLRVAPELRPGCREFIGACSAPDRHEALTPA